MHAKGLQEALRVVRSKTKVPPISERVEACKTFVERAKKRVQRAQEVMDKALAQRIVHEEEVAEGERRLALLQAEAATPGPDPIPQVMQLQQQIDSLVRERDALRANVVAATVPQDKPGQWMGDGQRSTIRRENSIHAHQPSGFGGLAQRKKLRAPERDGVWRR